MMDSILPREGRSMKVSLLLPEGAPAPESLPAFMRDTLRSDLKLDLLLDTVAMGDKAVKEAWASALLSPLQDTSLIEYRHEVLRDALAQPEALRAIYALCLEAEKRKSGGLGTVGWMSNYDTNATFNGAVEYLTAFTETLQKLRQLAAENEGLFQSRGLRALFRTLGEELSQEYLEEVRSCLSELHYPEGYLVSARLGDSLQGVDYVLQRREKKLLNLDLGGARSYQLVEKDEPAKDMGARRERAVNEAANALAQAAQYLASFFDKLRAELAFYLGCLTFSEGMQSVGMPVCFPVLTPMDTESRAWEGLYDVSLAVIKKSAVTGNDLRAEHKRLYLITGANQGGKTTFLRSLALGQLMAQCGMPVGAKSFTVPLRRAAFTHFKREEDRWMESGRLDEELERMRRITDTIRPGDLLLMNESFTSTGEREGSEIARQVTQALLDCGVEIAAVTHLHSYSSAFLGREDVLFLRAQRLEGGGRTYRILPGEPMETAYGEDIYNEVFLGKPLNLPAPAEAAPASPPPRAKDVQQEPAPPPPRSPERKPAMSMFDYTGGLSEEEIRRRKKKKKLEGIIVVTVFALLIILLFYISIKSAHERASRVARTGARAAQILTVDDRFSEL